MATFPFPVVHTVVPICTQSRSAHFILGGGGKRFSDNVGKTSVCLFLCSLPMAIVCHLHICIHVHIFLFPLFFLFFKRQVLAVELRFISHSNSRPSSLTSRVLELQVYMPHPATLAPYLYLYFILWYVTFPGVG